MVNYQKMFKPSTKGGFSRPEGAGNYDNMDDYNIVDGVNCLYINCANQISGASVVGTTISGSTFYGDASNMTGVTGADNLGDHIATQTISGADLMMTGKISGAHVNAKGTISGAQFSLIGNTFNCSGSLYVYTIGDTRFHTNNQSDKYLQISYSDPACALATNATQFRIAETILPNQTSFFNLGSQDLSLMWKNLYMSGDISGAARAYFSGDVSGANITQISGATIANKANMESLSGSLLDVSGSLVDLSGSVYTLSGSLYTLSGAVGNISGALYGLYDDYQLTSGSVLEISGSIYTLSGAYNNLSGSYYEHEADASDPHTAELTQTHLNLTSGAIGDRTGAASGACQFINVIFGTAETPPTASTTTDGTLYIQYTA